MEQSEPQDLTANEIREQAKIFKKGSISKYQSAVNDAAATICIRNPAMLTKRGELLTLAKRSVDESGFVYRKGKSRSKAFGSEADEPGPSAPKRLKITQQIRDTRQRNIAEDLKSINTHIQFKEKRIDTEVIAKNFRVCDLLAEEVSELKKRQVLTSELDSLIKKEKKI